jgi:hypothetical protein
MAKAAAAEAVAEVEVEVEGEVMMTEPLFRDPTEPLTMEMKIRKAESVIM